MDLGQIVNFNRRNRDEAEVFGGFRSLPDVSEVVLIVAKNNIDY